MDALEALASGPAQSWPVGARAVKHNWYIEEGEIEEWRGDVLLAVRSKGQFLGALGVLDEPPSMPGKREGTAIATSWYVRSAATVRKVEAEALLAALRQGGGAAAQIFHALMLHSRQWRRASVQALIRFAWAHLAGVGHTFRPAPYHSPGCDMFLVPIEVPAEVVGQMPPYVKVTQNSGEGDGSAYGVLVLKRFRKLLPASSPPVKRAFPVVTEAYVTLHAEVDGHPGMYVLWSFTNNARSAFLGRGVFGLPTMYGNLYIRPNADGYRLVASTGGTRAVDLVLQRKKARNRPASTIGLALLASSILGTRTDDAGLTDEQKTAATAIVGLLNKAGASEKAMASTVKKLQGSYATRLISWKRNFKPNAVAQKVVPWDPEDFSVDALVGSDLGISKISQVEVLSVDCDEPTHALQFLLSGTAAKLRMVGDLVLRLRGDVSLSPTPEDPLDYLASTRRLLNDGKPMMDKLSWGPGVWGNQASIPPLQALPGKYEPPPPVDNVASETAPDPLKALSIASSMNYPGVVPELAGLVKALTPGSTVVRYEQGERVCKPGDVLNDFHIVLQGRLDSWRGNAWCGPRTPGEPYTSLVKDQKFGLQLTATDTTWVWIIPRDVFLEHIKTREPWDAALGQLLWLGATVDVRATITTTRLLEQATYQFFPGARGVVMPGPYKADKVLQYNMPIRPNAWLKSLLPPGVEWHPDLPFALLVACHFQGFGPAQKDLAEGSSGGAGYHESGVMIPVRVKGSRDLRLFIPYIFPTSYMAMLAGREIYGYPKSWATVLVDEECGRILVRRNGVTMVALKHHPLPGSGFTNGFAKRFGWLFLKMIPDRILTVKVAAWKRDWCSEANVLTGEELARWNPNLVSIDQIASSGFVVDSSTAYAWHRLSDSTIEVRIPSGNDSGFDTVKFETFFGFILRVEYGVTMTTGDVLIDYLGVPTDLDQQQRGYLAPTAVNDRNRGPAEG